MFRYSTNDYNESLLMMGIIRVGTLHDFRRLEHQNGIADPQEGKKSVSHHIEHTHILDSNDPDAKTMENFGAVKFGNSTSHTIMKNIDLVKTFDHPDFFIFCTSHEASTAVMKEFEGADSCIEIVKVSNFYSLLTELINKHVPVEFQGVHKVVYQNKQEKWNGVNWGISPALIKEPAFIKQKEPITPSRAGGLVGNRQRRL